MPDNSRRNDREPPWGEQDGSGSVGFGRWLQQQREIRDIPLREIADVTKISLRYLEALEQDRFDVLPAPVFAKGFLREYSRFVGLDADEVVNAFLIATGEVVENAEERVEPESDEPGDSPTRTRVLASLAVLAIVIIVVAVAFVSRTRSPQATRSSPIAAPLPPAVPEPSDSAGEAAAEVIAMPLIVTIDFTEDCWMEAVVDDDRTISELRVQGEAMRLEAEERVILTLGNPAGVRVEVNGQPYDFSYSENRIVRNLEIDLTLADTLAGGESRNGG